MRISEIFYSIQGEGELTGIPSVFIRTSGCNLRCSWCDTPYASWRPEGEDLSIAEIVEATLAYPASHVVLTGGEPMIAKGIHELAAALGDAGQHITIETAGTVGPAGIACQLASLSPKLANSTPVIGSIDPAWINRHETTRLNLPVLREWIDAGAYQLKFVVRAAEDLQEIEALIASLERPIPPHRIQLMPEGTNADFLRQRYDLLVEACKRTGWRFITRLHVELFGNTRGT